MRLMGTGADVEWWHSMDIICQHEDSARTMSVWIAFLWRRFEPITRGAKSHASMHKEWG